MEELVTNLTNTEQVASEIISKYPEAILMLRPCFVSENDWELAITLKPSLFSKCPSKTVGICMAALSVDGLNLEHIDPTRYEDKAYREMCYTAVEQNPAAIALVPKAFRSRELKGLAYSKDPNLIMGKKLSTETILQMIRHRPSLIQDVKEPTDEMIITALSGDPRTIVYFKSISPKVKEFYEERFPQYAAMLIHD